MVIKNIVVLRKVVKGVFFNYDFIVMFGVNFVKFLCGIVYLIVMINYKCIRLVVIYKEILIDFNVYGSYYLSVEK